MRYLLVLPLALASTPTLAAVSSRKPAAPAAPRPAVKPVPAARPSDDDALAIRGVTLIDGTGRPPLLNACVVAVNGRITGAGVLGRVKIPAGARLLTAPRGSTLLPGLIDMHVHCSVQPAMMPYFLANGVTSVRDLGCAEGKVEELKKYRVDALSGKQVGPRLFMAGPPLDGFPRAANWFPGPGAKDAAEAVEGVKLLADQGADVIKLYRRLRTDVAKAAVDEAHRRNLPVTWDYQWNYRYLFNAIQTGVDGLEHVYYSERSSRDEYQQLAELIAGNKIWFDPTLVAFRPPDPEVTVDPDFQQLPPSLTRFWRGLFWPMETDAEFSAMKSFVRDVHRQGGRILIGTDSPVKYSAPGYGYHREMELLAECKLTPMEIVQAGTLHAAEALHRERELGTVQTGKLADLVVIQGDPLKDIRAARKVLWTFVNGRRYDPASLVQLARASAPAGDTKLPPYLHGD